MDVKEIIPGDRVAITVVVDVKSIENFTHLGRNMTSITYSGGRSPDGREIVATVEMVHEPDSDLNVVTAIAPIN